MNGRRSKYTEFFANDVTIRPSDPITVVFYKTIAFIVVAKQS